LKSIVKFRRFTLLVGAIMCGAGLTIFAIFSAQDFLTPGLIQQGVAIQEKEIQSHSSTSGILHLNEIDKPIAVLVSNIDSLTTFDMRVEGIHGTIFHDLHYQKGEVILSPVEPGDYQISLKNLSGKSVTVHVIYGLKKNYDNISWYLTALWALLVIGGNYLIIHTHFVSVKTKN
jgi:hypothetical protein